MNARRFQFIFRHRAPPQTKNLVALADQFRSERQADMATTNYQNAHDDI